MLRQRGQRRRVHRFVVETPKLVIEALESDLDVDYVVTPANSAPPAEFVHAVERAGVDLYSVDDRTFGQLSETTTPQPALAVVTAPSLGLDDRLVGPGARRLIVLIDVADPGNVGTLIRTAEAAGFTGVIAVGSTADVLSPKAVRSSSGSVLRVPLAEAETMETSSALSQAGITTIASAVGGQGYDEVPLPTERIALLLGSEAHGLDFSVVQGCDHVVGIPMGGAVESLNVATAGAVLAFEVARRARTR